MSEVTNLKKLVSILLAIVLLAAAAGCGSQDGGSSQPAAKDYTAILVGARDEEANQYNPVIGKGEDGKLTLTHNPNEADADGAQGMIEMTLEVMGLQEQQIEDLALSSSLMNISAYCVAIVKPAQGSGQAVAEALQNYLEQQQKSFENYLPDQYQITKDAKLETLKSGEVVLVMSQNAAEIFEKIQKEIEK